MINEIQRLITQVSEGGSLTREQASRAFQIIMTGGASPAQMAALLTALALRGETVEEITGAALVMRAKMDKVAAPANTIDVCGTGGDAQNMKMGGTLNVSTATAIVVAACGVPVAKHGNKSVSSQSGSADVLSALGVNIHADKTKAEASLEQANLCFLFAPLYHKAMRHVAPVRQELGIRTLFNLIGPLANPAMPKRQLMGVYDRKLLQPMAEALKALGSKRAWVVHGSDGMDEITLYGPTHVAELKDGVIRLFDVTPAEAGLEVPEEPDALAGKGPMNNARELSLMLAGKQSAYRDVVLYNAAAALVIAGAAANLREGVEKARAAIDSGKAKETLAALVSITNDVLAANS